MCQVKCKNDVGNAKLLEELRVLVKGAQSPLPPRLDDEFLNKFLRVRNYNVEKAFQSIINYYSNIYTYRDYYHEVEPSQLTAAFESQTASFLKNRSAGRRIGLIQVGNWDTKEISLKNIQLSALYQGQYVSLEPETQHEGIVGIFDLTGLSLSHILKNTFKEVKRLTSLIQGGPPAKTSELHIVNPPKMVGPILSLVSQLLTKKMQERLHIHYNVESLHKFIDTKILPSSLGGTLGEKEAIDMNLVEHILKENIQYEGFWNAEKTDIYKPTASGLQH